MSFSSSESDQSGLEGHGIFGWALFSGGGAYSTIFLGCLGLIGQGSMAGKVLQKNVAGGVNVTDAVTCWVGMANVAACLVNVGDLYYDFHFLGFNGKPIMI